MPNNVSGPISGVSYTLSFTGPDANAAEFAWQAGAADCPPEADLLNAAAALRAIAGPLNAQVRLTKAISTGTSEEVDLAADPPEFTI